MGNEYERKLNKQVSMGASEQIAVWRVAWEPGTVAVLIREAGVSLGWLLLPLFLTPVTTSQVSLILPRNMTLHQQGGILHVPERKRWVFFCLYPRFREECKQRGVPLRAQDLPQNCLVMGPQLLSVRAVWSLEQRISVHCKWATTVPSGGVGFFMVPWHPLLAPLPVTTEVPTCACEQWSCIDRSVCFLGTQDVPTGFPRSLVKYSSIQDRALGLGLRIRAHTKDKKVLSSFLALLLDGDASKASIVEAKPWILFF